MGEAVPVEPRFLDQPGVAGGFERLERVELAPSGGAGGDPQVEVEPDDGSRPKEFVDLGREPGHAAPHCLGHAAG